MRKRIIKQMLVFSLSLALIAVATISAYAANNSGAHYHWRWSHYGPMNSIVDQTSKAIVKEIEEKSNGRIKIDIYPASQLGDWMEVSEQVMRGSVEIALQPVSPSYDKRLQVRVLPYSVMNYNEAETAYYGKDPYLFNIMANAMEANDMKALAVVAEGFGGGGFAEVPENDVLDPNVDKKGLKMRFPPGNQAWENMVRSFGFAPTPVPWGELYMALQTKLVDAQVGGQPYNTWSTFRDVVKCWVQYNTHFQNSFVYMNNDLWKSLSKEDQDIIQQASINQAKKSFKQAQEQDRKYMKMMADSGIKVIVPTDKELAKLATVAREKVWPVMDKVIGKKIMNQMRAKAGI